MKKIIKLNKNFLNLIGYNENHNKDDIIKTAIENFKKTIKPCEKLNYCPYGYLVEHFPLLPTTKTQAQKWYNHVNNFIKKGEYKGNHLKKCRKGSINLI